MRVSLSISDIVESAAEFIVHCSSSILQYNRRLFFYKLV